MLFSKFVSPVCFFFKKRACAVKQSTYIPALAAGRTDSFGTSDSVVTPDWRAS